MVIASKAIQEKGYPERIISPKMSGTLYFSERLTNQAQPD
jgi:hypothetical protein